MSRHNLETNLQRAVELMKFDTYIASTLMGMYIHHTAWLNLKFRNQKEKWSKYKFYTHTHK